MCGKLKVATILDKFSYECLKYECDLIPLEVINWEETFVNENPHMLFVESSWYKVIERSTIIEKIVNECKRRNIPTVFWNKEDPLFFKKFIKIAKLFDYVFTTDEGCIKSYRSVLGHKNIYVLPFAAQLKLHNPIDKDKIRLGKVAFAGTWYGMYPQRKNDMEMVLKPALKYGIHIYDRMHNDKRKRFAFPKRYQPYIKGVLPYEEIVSIYKKYDVFLNVNLIRDSSTMFSRRVFELLACGTNVISSYALGIDKLLSRVVKLCKKQKEVIKHLDVLLYNKELRDKISVLGQREVFKYHTYKHRMQTVLDKIGFDYKKKGISGVSIIICINSFDYMEKIWANFQRQHYENKELIVILNNGSIDIKEWEEQIKCYNNVKIIQVDESKSLGACLNFAVNQASYKYISKFDDYDYYAPEFIGDLMYAFEYTDANIVGKHTYYVYLQENKNLAIRFYDMENRYVNFLCPSAFIMEKEICSQIKFKDMNIDPVKMFFEECIKSGHKLYSTDRFNYVCLGNDNKILTNNKKLCHPIIFENIII